MLFFFCPIPLPQHSRTSVTDNFYKGILSALQQTLNIFMNGKARHLQVVHTQTCTFNLEGSLSWTGRKKPMSATGQCVFLGKCHKISNSSLIYWCSREHLNNADITPKDFWGTELPRTVWQNQVINDFWEHIETETSNVTRCFYFLY